MSISTRTRRAQRLWLRLSIIRRNKWKFPSRRGRDLGAGRGEVSVEIISAITGEITRAIVREESRQKLKKWLSFHNVKAQVDRMIVPKNSTWSRMTDDDWKDYPIILKVGTYKTPYIVDHAGQRTLIKKTTVCTLFLKTVDNINYMEAISIKKKMAKELIEAIKRDLLAAKKAKRLKKRRSRKKKWMDDSEI